jgi:hypothetical protein
MSISVSNPVLVKGAEMFVQVTASAESAVYKICMADLVLADSNGLIAYPVLMLSSTVPREMYLSSACFPIDPRLGERLALPWKLVSTIAVDNIRSTELTLQ